MRISTCYRYRLSALAILGLLLTTGLLSCIPLTDSNSGRPLFRSRDYGKTPDPGPEILPPVRPDNLFRIKPNYCLCRGGQPAMALAPDHCTQTCTDISSEGNQNTYLRGEVEVIGLQANLSHEQFQGDLNRFCSLVLDPDNEKNPICRALVSELHSGNPEIVLDQNAITISNNNRFQILFTEGLQENKSYSFRLQSYSQYTHPSTGESSFLTGHTSTIQFQVKTPKEPHNFGGPLKVGTTKRYYCIFTSSSNPNSIENTFTQHFFFDAATNPPLVPDSVTSVYCHNKDSSTDNNDPLFRPRLGEEVAFNLWDKTDRRFYRNSGRDKEIDINEFIKTRLLEKHNIITGGELGYFSPLEFPSFPNITATGVSQNTNANLNLAGFYLTAFVDPDGDGFPLCPSAFDLQRPESDERFDPIFDVLGEFIHATEALYVALRTPREIDPVSQSSVDDILFINENLAKKIWFYRDNNNRLQFLDANSENFKNLVSSNAIYFYWPADPVAPTVKKLQQKIYQIRDPNEIRQEMGDNSNGEEDLGPAPFADRRIGCIPKF